MRLLPLALSAAAAALLLLAPPAAPAGLVEPTDPSWANAWGARLEHLPAAWNVTTGNPSVVIATIDTGAQPIVDLAGALVPGWDFVAGDALPRDTFGHGTAVASIIAARADNGVGISGICWACRLMPVRVAADHSATAEMIAEGIRWAVDHGARIVNVSLSAGGDPSPAEEDAVTYALAHEVLVVASAGNTGTDAPQYPAAIPGVLAVGATDTDDSLYAWSARGAWVSLAAPGCQPVDGTPKGWGILCGSSVAPAVVAGIAGLALSFDPALTVDELTAALENAAVPVAGIAGGRVDAYATLAQLGSRHTEPVFEAAREIRIETGTLHGSLQLTLSMMAGPFRAELHAPRAGRCSMTLLGPAEAIAVPARGPGETQGLDTIAQEGAHELTVDCAGLPAQSYSLEITGLFAAP